MTLDEAARVLLKGVTGCNAAAVSDATGVSRAVVARYVADSERPHARSSESVQKIHLYIFQQLNAHLLLCDTDRIESSELLVESTVVEVERVAGKSGRLILPDSRARLERKERQQQLLAEKFPDVSNVEVVN